MPSLVKELGPQGRVTLPSMAGPTEGLTTLTRKTSTNGYAVVQSAAESWGYDEVREVVLDIH